jgi:hypothetical protein
MNEDHLSGLAAQYQAELNRVESKRIEALAHYESVCHAIFTNSETAQKNIVALQRQIGPTDTFTVIERGGVFDFRTRTWISLRHHIGETRSANEAEIELVERSLYEVREAWMDVEHQTRQYDKVERQLRIVLEEKARRMALSERGKIPAQQQNQRSATDPRHELPEPVDERSGRKR